MSLAFTISEAPYPEAALLQRVVPEGVQVRDDASLTSWSGGAAWLIWPRRSTRGVPLLWSSTEGLVVRVLVLASVDDLQLALQVACGVAAEHGLLVDDGTGPTVPAEVLARWDMARCLRHVHEDAQDLMRMVANGPMRLGAVNRPIRVGPRVRNFVDEDPDALGRWLLWTQWLEGEPPAAPDVEPTGDLAASSMVRLSPGTRTLLPAVDLVQLEGEPSVVVQRRVLARLLGGRARRFDEDRMLVDALTRQDFHRLREVVLPEQIDDPATWEPRPDGQGPVIAMLRSPSWPRRATALCWPVCERGEGLPVVSLARDAGTHIQILDADAAEARGWELAYARAVARIEERAPPFEEDVELGRRVGLRLDGTWAAEVLICENLLLQAQERLGARAMLAAVPRRGTLRLRDAFPDDIGAVSRLMAWADTEWRQAATSEDGEPLSPRILVIVDGRVQGPVREPARDEVSVDDATLDAELIRDPLSGGEIVEDEQTEGPAPEPWQVAAASVLVPGLGHWWLGARIVAAGFAVAFVSVIAVLAALHVIMPSWTNTALGPILVVVGAAAAVALIAGWDAFQRARGPMGGPHA